MAKSKVQIQFEADTDNFSQGVKKADKSLVTLRNELKLNSASLKETGDSVDLLSQRHDILQKEQEQSSSKVEALESKLSKAKLVFGEDSQEVYKLTNQLIKAKTEFQNIQNDITQTEKKMADLGDETNQLDNALDDVENSASKVGDGFTIMKGTMADLVSSGIKNIISSVGDLVGSILELNEATKEYRQMQSKLEGAANNSAHSVDFVKEKYKELYGYLGDDQMSTNAITNLAGLAIETDSVSNLVEGAIGVWSSYGDSIPIESLTEAINETVQVGKVTGTFADTINWSTWAVDGADEALQGHSKSLAAFNKALDEGQSTEDAFSAALSSTTNIQERADIVAKFLNTTYGESKNKYDELSGSLIETNEAELELKETQSKMAEVVSPLNNVFTDFKSKALEKLIPVMSTVVSWFKDMLSWLNQHPAVLKIVTALVKSMAIAFGILATALAIQGLIKGVTTAIAFLNTTLLANPIVLIVAAIAALVTAFITLWNNCEGFRNFWQGLWDGIKNIFNIVVDAIKIGIQLIIMTFQNMWNNIKFVIDLVVGIIQNMWNIISSIFNLIWQVISTIVQNIWNIISTYFNMIYTVISTILNSIWSVISGIFTAIWTTISGVMNSIWSVISSIWNSISSTVMGIVTGISNTISNVFNGVKNTVSNIFNGIKNTATNVWNGIKNAIMTPINSAKNMIKKAIDQIKGFFNFNIKWPKIKLPHFKIEGSFNPVDWLDEGIPKIKVDWYASGAIFTKPTLLSTNTGVKGVGEAGAEGILPIEKLETWITNALNQNNLQMLSVNNSNSQKLIEIAEKILAKDANMYLNARKVSEALSNSNDEVSGELVNLKERGLVL